MASKARQNGVCNYMAWTTEELIEGYAWEANRINQKDRETAQRLIKQELKRRFNKMLELLDDERMIKNPGGVYMYLLNDYGYKG